MAYAIVQTSSKVSAGPVFQISTITFASAPIVGNAVVVLINGWRSSALDFHTTACSDNHGNPYSRAVVQLNTPVACAIYYCALVGTTGTPFTITVNPGQGTGSYFVACALEVSGVGTGLQINQTVGATGNSASPATGATAALTTAETLLVTLHAIAAAQGSITVQVVSPVWVQAFEELPFNYIAGEGDRRIVTSATGTTPSGSWTDTATGPWAAALVAFGEPGAAAVETATSFIMMPV